MDPRHYDYLFDSPLAEFGLAIALLLFLCLLFNICARLDAQCDNLREDEP